MRIKALESSDSRAFFLHLYLEKQPNYSRLSLLGGTAEYSAVQDLVHEMNRGCRTSGVKWIRTHDLRHSHVSLLINMCFSALNIAERVSHEVIGITYRYAHLFPANRADPELMPSLNRRDTP